MIQTIILFILIYIISDKLSHKTLLSNYKWYDDLSLRLYDYEGKLKSALLNLYYFKIFTCRSCNVFWIAMTLYSLFILITSQLNLFGNYLDGVDIVIFSLLTFLVHKVENQNV